MPKSPLHWGINSLCQYLRFAAEIHLHHVTSKSTSTSQFNRTQQTSCPWHRDNHAAWHRDAAMAVAVGGRSMQPGLDILAAIMHTSCWLLYPTGWHNYSDSARDCVIFLCRRTETEMNPSGSLPYQTPVAQIRAKSWEPLELLLRQRNSSCLLLSHPQNR